MALEKLEDEVNGLSREIAGMRPLVREMHNNMPRIATALETLARVTEKLESNTEDHKRIHYRISEFDEHHKELKRSHQELRRQFEDLRDDHLVCTTTNSLRQSVEKESLWGRLKVKAAEKAVEVALVACLGFLAWLVLYHLPHYPGAASIVASGG